MAKDTPAILPYPRERELRVWSPTEIEPWVRLLVVQIPAGVARLGAQSYLSLLSDRLAWLIQRAGADEKDRDIQPTLDRVEERFRSAGLLVRPARRPNLGVFTLDMVAENPLFIGGIEVLGLWSEESKLEEFLPSAKPALLAFLKRTDLGEWLEIATSLRLHDRGATKGED